MSDTRAIRHLAGRVVMVGFHGFTAAAEEPIAADLAELHLAGVILFNEHVPARSHERNVQSPGQLSTLTRQLHAVTPDLLIAIDQEGGAVARLNRGNGFSDWPGHAALGRGPLGATRAAATDVARTLRRCGINLNFAPCVDIDLNPANPIIGRLGRSFGPDHTTVTAHARAFLDAHASVGVAATLKHFPGHGSSAEDTHLQAVDITARFADSELEPYRALHGHRGVGAIMLGHLRHAGVDPDHPASLSRPWVARLREEIGYRGVVITDGLEMAAVADAYPLVERVARALNAGVDLLLFGNNLAYDPHCARQVVESVVQAVVDGGVTLEVLADRARRVDRLRARLVGGAFPPDTRD